ncbi:hypothetical protein AURDEDRAFT_85664 [Auricularia subglabra TFB-10046 SS5]|nr:hypothetical protein AURDEDRAFT_85664 [Auricularia subglabra TFB-10046 SS5]
MSRPSSPDGSASASHYAQGLSSPPAVARLSPDICSQLSVFKELMREYRKIDDTITMRLNRTTAQFRERERTGDGYGSSTLSDDACAFFWTHLVAHWKGRAEVVQYCVDVVDKSMDEKRATLASRDTSLEADARLRRKLQGELYADEVKRTQMHSELTVEQIIRQRSFDAFRSRCKFWQPPPGDSDARKWWDAAQQRR